jgi:hypothetical protein
LILNVRFFAALRRALIIAVSSTIASFATVYAVDYAAFRYRVAANRNPFGQVTVQSYEAVAQKSGKTQFIFNPPEAQTCVHSLFPHSGLAPCWYLERNPEQRTDI